MPSGKFFYIESKLNGLVLDIKGADESPGTEVIPWEKGDEKENQLWWQDNHTGTIRTKLNGFCLDIDGSSEAKLHVYVHASRQNYLNVVRVVSLKFFFLTNKWSAFTQIIVLTDGELAVISHAVPWAKLL